MLRRIVTILAVVILLPAFLSAQEKTILRPDGKIIKHKGDLKTLEVQSIKERKTGNQVVTKSFSGGPNSTLATRDTLRYPGGWTTGFIFYGQDVMLQWFKCPADLDLLQVGFACNENNDGMFAEVKVVSVNWTVAELKNAGEVRRGYYEALGNGYNDISAFMDN